MSLQLLFFCRKYLSSHDFKILFYLLIATVPCKASDSLTNEPDLIKINITTDSLYLSKLNAIKWSPSFPARPFVAFVKMPSTLQPFIDPQNIQYVCQEFFEKKKSTFFNGKLLPDKELAYLKAITFMIAKNDTAEWGSLRNENASVWKKVGRGEKFIGGAELVGMGILMMMPREITKWQKGWLEKAGTNIKTAFTTMPVMDKDNWQLNYVGHPVAGAIYYNALRSQNATWFQSFLFATAQSFIWEYVVEGIAEPPSVQDLIVTPVAGAFLGETFHRVTMRMRRNGFSFIEKVATLILNPMFVINNGFGPKHNPVCSK